MERATCIEPQRFSVPVAAASPVLLACAWAIRAIVAIERVQADFEAAAPHLSADLHRLPRGAYGLARDLADLMADAVVVSGELPPRLPDPDPLDDDPLPRPGGGRTVADLVAWRDRRAELHLGETASAVSALTGLLSPTDDETAALLRRLRAFVAGVRG
jgi:hypothetical protein